MTPNISLVAGDRAIQFGYIEHIENLKIGSDRIPSNGVLNLEIGSLTGGIVNISASNLQIPPTPRPTPVLLLPCQFPKLIGRQEEIKTALDAISHSQSMEFYGIAGIGKTVLLRYLAHHPAIASTFIDGIIHFQSTYHQTDSDLLQAIFDAFYECKTPYKATDIQIRYALKGKKAIIILDSAHLSKEDIESLVNALPDCSFLFAFPERYFWGEGQSTALNGLNLNEAISLVTQTLGRELSSLEYADAEKLCTILRGHPLQILQAVALVREQKSSLASIVKQARLGNTNWLTQLINSLSQPQRWILALLAAFGANVAISAEAVAGITALPDANAILATLLRKNLVSVDGDRFQITSSLSKLIQQQSEVNIWIQNATQFFTQWAQQHQGLPDLLLQESDAIMRVMEWSMSAGRGIDVIRLGRTIESVFALSGQWGKWQEVLQWMLESARSNGDRTIEAFALHQMGTRALCLNQLAIAQDYLTQALEIRRSLSDRVGTEATEHNLNLILHLTSPFLKKPSTNISSWIWKGSIPIFLLAITVFLLSRKTMPPIPTTSPSLPKENNLELIIQTAKDSAKQGVFDSLSSMPKLPNLQSIDIVPKTAKAGDRINVELVIVLDNPAPDEGATIVLTSSNQALAGELQNLKIEAGQYSGSLKFDIPSNLSSNQTEKLTITAIYRGVKRKGEIKFEPKISTAPAIEIAELSFSQNPVQQETKASLQIRLTSPAPNQGAIIYLASDNSSLVGVPESITILAGQSISEQIPLLVSGKQLRDQSKQLEVIITAQYDMPSKSKISNVLTIISKENPQELTPNLKSITLDREAAQAGDLVSGLILLDAPAPNAGFSVKLESNPMYLAQDLESPIKIRVNNQEQSFSFRVPKRLAEQDTSVTIIASDGKTERKIKLPFIKVPSSQRIPSKFLQILPKIIRIPPT